MPSYDIDKNHLIWYSWDLDCRRKIIHTEAQVSFLKKLFGCFFAWRPKPSSQSDLRNADVILGQSFGSPSECLSNVDLAEVADQLAARYGLPLVAQWEVAYQLRSSSAAAVIWKHSIPDRYLDTYEVLKQGAETCLQHGWNRVVILAHPDHLWRCAKVAEKLGLEVLVPDVAFVRYDPRSGQEWTRSRFQFVPREILVRLLFLFKGGI